MLSAIWHLAKRFCARTRCDLFCYDVERFIRCLHFQPNKRLIRKLPADAECASLLVGHVDFLDDLAIAYFRFCSPTVIDGLTEVALPMRFLFIAVGPPEASSIVELSELGRAFATLLNDRVRIRDPWLIRAVSSFVRRNNSDHIVQVLAVVTREPIIRWTRDTFPQSDFFTHAIGSCVSIAIIRVCVWFCDSVCLSTLKKPKRLKRKSPNLAQG